MSDGERSISGDVGLDTYKSLAEFRLTLRRFFSFSEKAASTAGLTSQQYQLLLAVRAAPKSEITIGDLADHLFLRPHSVTGLIDRLDRRGMVQRSRRPEDRREVSVTLTKTGALALASLASAHRSELRRLRPMLKRILEEL